MTTTDCSIMVNMEKQQKSIIGYLKIVHSKNKKSTDFTKNDRRHAIYLLQGAAITSCETVYSIKNNIGALQREWRFIRETADLIEYFDTLPESDRHLKAWFRGEVITPLPRTKRQRRDGCPGLPSKLYDQMDKLGKKLIDTISKGLHPTRTAVQTNFNRISKDFDYEHRFVPVLDDYHINASFIVPAIQSFVLPFSSFKLDKDDFQRLLSWHDQFVSFNAS